jgi:hypothetical protein
MLEGKRVKLDDTPANRQICEFINQDLIGIEGEVMNVNIDGEGTMKLCVVTDGFVIKLADFESWKVLK